MQEILIPFYIFIFKGEEHKISDIDDRMRGHSEFELNIVKKTNLLRTPKNLMINIQKVISEFSPLEDEVLIFGSADFEFTNSYSKSFLIETIIDADEFCANMLLGDVIGHKHMVPINKRIFWVDTFYETSFFVLFRRFFDGFLEEKDCRETFGDKLSEITSNKLVIYPFITKPKEGDVISKHDSYEKTVERVAKGYRICEYFHILTNI